MKRKLLAVFLTLCMILGMSGVGAYGAETVWQEETPIPTARINFAAAAVGDNIYVIGGYVNNTTIVGTVEAYNTKTKTWDTMESMLYPKKNATAEVVGDKIYVFGGELSAGTSCDDVQIYDTKTNTWNKGAAMSQARADFGSAAIGDKIYVFGGSLGYKEFLNTVEVYDTVSSTWSNVKSMPTGTDSFAYAVSDGKVYAIGGNGTGSATAVSTVQIYNSAVNSWSLGKNMPTQRSQMTAKAVDGKIYVIAGYGTDGARYSSVEVYDTATNSWSVGLPIDRTRENHQSAVVDGKMYVIGGYASGTGDLNPMTSVISLQIGEPAIPEDPEPSPYNLALYLEKGQQSQLCVTEYLEDNVVMIWTSSDQTVAMVDSNGKITAVEEGICDITAQNSSGTFSKSIPVRVMGGSSGGNEDVVYEKVNNDDSRITYSGKWTLYSNDPAFYNNDEHFSNQSGAYTEFTFEGTGVNWIGATSNNLGLCDIYIDGELVQAGLDQYGSSLEAQKVLFSKTGLVHGQHTIKIVVTGEKNSSTVDAYSTIDAFEVLRRTESSH